MTVGSYRIFLSAIPNLCTGELLGKRKIPESAIENFAPVAVPSKRRAEQNASEALPNFYIDGLNVTDAFVLVMGTRITKADQDVYACAGSQGKQALALYKTSQFREADSNAFLRSLETKVEFEQLIHSLGARYDQNRDGHLAPLRLADNLEGKTICLYRGGGIGDTIHYVRYARVLRSRGARVIVMCGAREAPLLRNADGVDAVVPGAEASICDPVLPNLPECDLGISFVAVPFICGINGKDICCSRPYLQVDAQSVEEARRQMRPDAVLRVGLCWQSGCGPPRAISIRELLSMLRTYTHCVEFISLQRGERQADVRAMREEGIRITDLETAESSLVDTAAVIANLDLVISVDTMICHLAGAMGKQVWTILTNAPDWRWLRDREDTPWYPSMRLFRQGSDKLYGPVVERISEELAGLTSP